MLDFDPELFIKLFDSLIAGARQPATALVADGRNLTFVLFCMVIGWQLFKTTFSDEMQECIAAIFHGAVKASIVLFMLTGWGTGGAVEEMFYNQFDAMARKIDASSQTPTLGLKGMLNMINVITKDHTVVPKCREETVNVDQMGNPLGTEETLVDCAGGGDSTMASLIKFMGSPDKWIIAALLKMFAIGMFVIMVAVYLLIGNIGAILLGIGMAVGPVLVPWLLIPRMEYLFDGWLKYMISSALMKVVGAVVLIIVGGAITSAKTLTDTYLATKEGMAVATMDIVALMFVLIIIGIGTYVMWQVPAIATGLISGNGRTDIRGFGKGAMGSYMRGSIGGKIGLK